MLYLLLPVTYLAFAWQAALRSQMTVAGATPNFLALVMLLVLCAFGDTQALLLVAGLGLLSDSLASHHLGCDMLCYVLMGVLLQWACHPRLVKHPSLMVLLTIAVTGGLDLASTMLRGLLNHELSGAGVDVSQRILEWTLLALGNGFYTGLIAILPCIAINTWQVRTFQNDRRTVVNQWHRLTS